MHCSGKVELSGVINFPLIRLKLTISDHPLFYGKHVLSTSYFAIFVNYSR